MHTGDEVYITKTGKFYHYFDDDCPTTAKILKGKTAARKVKEHEAKQMGYALCKHCSKEYAQDLAKRQGCGAVALFIIAGGSATNIIMNYFI